MIFFVIAEPIMFHSLLDCLMACNLVDLKCV